MWIPVVIIFLLLAGAAVLWWLPGRFLHLVWPTAVAGVAFCLLLWLWTYTQLPRQYSLAPADSGSPLLAPALIWRIDEVSWPVTAWLLLLLAALLAASRPALAGGAARLPARPYALALALTAVTLIGLWAYSPAAALPGWTLLLAGWGTAVWLAGAVQGHAIHGDGRRFLVKLGLLLAALLLLWLGAAAEAELPLWLAALLQMGIWPLAGWRPALAGWRPGLGGVPLPLAALLLLAPVVTGAALLLRLAQPGWSGAALLLLTLVGLVGLLRGLQLIWARLHLPLAAAGLLVMVQAHLLLLTVVWGSAAGGQAWLRVLILSSGIFFLVWGRPSSPARMVQIPAPALALAALAGLPLTAGLAGHVALYEGLRAGGQWLLLLVVVLLQVPLLTAVMQLCWGSPPAPEEQPAWLPAGAATLLALGLLSAAGVAGGGVSILTWLLLSLAPAAALILFRFVPRFRQTAVAVRQAFTFKRPGAARLALVRQWWRGLAEALDEAAAILEGDGSLLWLLVLIIIFLFVR